MKYIIGFLIIEIIMNSNLANAQDQDTNNNAPYILQCQNESITCEATILKIDDSKQTHTEEDFKNTNGYINVVNEFSFNNQNFLEMNYANLNFSNKLQNYTGMMSFNAEQKDDHNSLSGFQFNVSINGILEIPQIPVPSDKPVIEHEKIQNNKWSSYVERFRNQTDKGWKNFIENDLIKYNSLSVYINNNGSINNYSGNVYDSHTQGVQDGLNAEEPYYLERVLKGKILTKEPSNYTDINISCKCLMKKNDSYQPEERTNPSEKTTKPMKTNRI